ncbi:hypothetical protein BLM37_00150 [Candidatus Gracilibacteria bacterium GN02-873]|nr:hypothetical protein BLM37_00150 [Candidatus Gracilibacteria bacterium GN02-873]
MDYHGNIQKSYPVSTAKNGIGNADNSEQTSSGTLEINHKIGGKSEKMTVFKENVPKVLQTSKLSIESKIISLLGFGRSEALTQSTKTRKIGKFIFMEQMKNFGLDNPLLMAVFVGKMIILSSFSVLGNIVQKCKSPKIKNPFRGIFYCKNLYYYFFRENFSLFKPKYYYKNLQ